MAPPRASWKGFLTIATQIAAAMPESEKRLTVFASVDHGDMDDAFELIREGLRGMVSERPASPGEQRFTRR